MTALAYLALLMGALALLAPLCDEHLVGNVDRLAGRHGWSEGSVGSGLLAIGSSAPELMIAMLAVLVGGGRHASIGAATIVGSALFNLLVIVGLCAWIRTLRMPLLPLVRDCVFYAAGVGWLIWTLWDGEPGWWELATAFILYAAYLAFVGLSRADVPVEETEDVEEIPVGHGPPHHRALRVLFRPLGSVETRILWAIVLLAGLSWVMVHSAIRLSRASDVPESVIALTVLAVGTSIPDLLSSLAAARRRRATMAVSNAIGSNVFDILPGLALPWLVATSLRGTGSLSLAEGPVLSGAWVLGSSAVVLPLAFAFGRRGELGRTGGGALILVYLGYLVWELGLS